MKTKLLIFIFIFIASSAQADDISAKLDAISAKIDSLQANVISKLEELQKDKSAASEESAKTALTEIQGLISANNYDQAKAKISEFQKNFAGTPFANSVERIKNELDVVGKPIPSNWNIDKWYQMEKDIDLNSDKPMFVVFWEVWCPHCRREIPKIVELKNKFATKGVQFAGLTRLSRGSQETELLNFIKENKVNYPIAKESGTTSEYFAVSGVPAAVFIKNKKVIWRGHPALVTADKIEEWIK